MPRTPRTHLEIDRRLCGEPAEIERGRAQVRLTTLPEMAADHRGLVHGGFVFGLADYAAMLAVNDPNVVLGAADVRFTAPVEVGDELLAEATVSTESGREREVRVEVRSAEKVVVEGLLTCFVLEHHVLGPSE